MGGLLTFGFGTPTLLDFGFTGPFLANGPWAGIGITLVIASDGTITGNPVFSVYAGAPFGILVQGIPFVEEAIPTVSLYLNTAATPSIPVVTPEPDGSTSAGYSALLILPGSATRLAPGIYPYRITLTGPSKDEEPIVVSRFRVLPGAPVPPGPQVITRGTADTVTLTFTNADGSAYSLGGLSLVWTMGGVTKTQAGGQILVGSAASGVAIVQLAPTDTAALVTGTLTFTVTDATSGTQLGTGTILVN